MEFLDEFQPSEYLEWDEGEEDTSDGGSYCEECGGLMYVGDWMEGVRS